jgi:NAD(P)-dependent dehydrogenase (short-subunit alcohol dehydrogenase family)
MSTDLSGKVAIVTGAARGLGLLVTQDLAREGMAVVGADVRADELDQAMGDVAKQFPVETLAVRTDVGEERDVTSLVERTKKKFGRVDVLVNNAGIREVAPVWETSTAMWDRILDTNLKGEFLCSREVLAQDMLDRGEGTIIFVSSIAGRRGNPNSSAYAASKWGVLGFAESLAKELKNTRIRVTVITPGRTETPMARESEAWELGLNWLDPKPLSRAIVFCIKQDPSVVIPELHVIHRDEL